jgi:hypothetical protein
VERCTGSSNKERNGGSGYFSKKITFYTPEANTHSVLCNANPYKHPTPISYMQLWKVVALAVLVVSLGSLIYIFQDAEPGEPIPVEDKPQRSVMLDADYFPILCDILIIVIILSGIKGVRKRAKPQIPDESSNWLVLMVMRIGMLAGIGVFYFIFLRRRAENKDFLNVFQRFRELVNPQSQIGEFVLSEPTAFDQFILVMLSLLMIVLIIMFIVLMIRSPSPPSEEPLLVSFPEYIIRKGEYTFDGDPRDVVINAYGATLHDLYKKGVKIPEHFTPWEFQQQIGNPHLHRLTQLFEKARYSTHPISGSDSEEALKKYMLMKEEEITPPELPEE